MKVTVLRGLSNRVHSKITTKKSDEEGQTESEGCETEWKKHEGERDL